MHLHHYSGMWRISLSSPLLIWRKRGSLTRTKRWPELGGFSVLWGLQLKKPLLFLGLVVGFLIHAGWWPEPIALPFPVSPCKQQFTCAQVPYRHTAGAPPALCARGFPWAPQEAGVWGLSAACVTWKVLHLFNCFGSDCVSLEKKPAELCQMKYKCSVCDGAALTWLWAPLCHALRFALMVQAEWCGSRQSQMAGAQLSLFRKISNANLEWRQSLCVGQRPWKCRRVEYSSAEPCALIPSKSITQEEGNDPYTAITFSLCVFFFHQLHSMGFLSQWCCLLDLTPANRFFQLFLIVSHSTTFCCSDTVGLFSLHQSYACCADLYWCDQAC